MHLIEALAKFLASKRDERETSLALELTSHLAISEETQTVIASSPVLLDHMHSALVSPTAMSKEKERVLDCIQKICQPKVAGARAIPELVVAGHSHSSHRYRTLSRTLCITRSWSTLCWHCAARAQARTRSSTHSRRSVTYLCVSPHRH